MAPSTAKAAAVTLASDDTWKNVITGGEGVAMGSCHKALSSEIACLLDESERLGSCLAAVDVSLYRALRNRLSAMGLVSPYPRLFARTSYWSGLNKRDRALNVLRGFHVLSPGWVFAADSAALLLGLEVPYPLVGTTPCVASDIQQRSRMGSIRRCPHVFERPIKLEVKTLSSRPVYTTGILQTAFDCMRMAPFRYGVAVADSALAVGGFSKEELVAYVDVKKGGFRGAPRAREAARFADSRSDNGGESVVRAIIHELGYMAPELQVPFKDPIDAGRIYYADFAWELQRGLGPDGRTIDLVIGELDGLDKYFNSDMNGGLPARALLRERRRESRLTLMGAPIMRFSYGEALDVAYFDKLLRRYGIPRDHAPVCFPETALSGWNDEVPVEAYGLA